MKKKRDDMDCRGGEIYSKFVRFREVDDVRLRMIVTHFDADHILASSEWDKSISTNFKLSYKKLHVLPSIRSLTEEEFKRLKNVSQHSDKSSWSVIEVQPSHEEGANVPEEAYEPPAHAEFLIAMLSPRSQVEAILGDLEQRFHENCRSGGITRARRLYWAEVLRSLWPLAKRAGSRIAWWAAIISVVRKYFAG